MLEEEESSSSSEDSEYVIESSEEEEEEVVERVGKLMFRNTRSPALTNFVKGLDNLKFLSIFSQEEGETLHSVP